MPNGLIRRIEKIGNPNSKLEEVYFRLFIRFKMTDSKYDRQLRLWGKHGQSYLSEAKILCTGSSVVLVEALKNLILPGIGFIGISNDGMIVSETDLGNNFYLGPKDLGRNRCHSVVEELGKLNPTDCRIEIFSDVSKDIEFDILLTDRSVLCDNICATHIVQIACSGFKGNIEIIGPAHIVIESHENKVPDYRLSNPWPELSVWALEQKEGPFFAQLIANETSEETKLNAYLLTALVPEDEVLTELTNIIDKAPRTEFNIKVVSVIKAVLHFHSLHHVLPLSVTNLPDMKCSTEVYTELVQIYKTKFMKDLAEVKLMVDLDKEFVEWIVRNIRNLSLVEFSNQPRQTETGTCLNAISTIVGSVAAQEIVKLITHQFVPQCEWELD